MEVLVRGPGQAAAAMTALLLAGHCAGLLAKGHSCRWLESRGTFPEALAVANSLPVRHCRATDGVDEWRGVEPDLLVALLSGVLGDGWAAGTCIRGRQCQCGIKTALLPAHSVPAWRGAMRGTPFGAGAVVT